MASAARGAEPLYDSTRYVPDRDTHTCHMQAPMSYIAARCFDITCRDLLPVYVSSAKHYDVVGRMSTYMYNERRDLGYQSKH